MSFKKVWNLIWKYARAWFLTSVIVIASFFTATMVATQNDFLSGTIDTVLGGEGRRNVKGDPDKYNRFPKSTEGFKQFKTDMKLGTGVIASGKEKETVLKEANRLNEEIVSEGIVLLKNKGEKDNRALPLAKGAKISVFGKNSANIVLGGSGSGGGNAKNSVSLYEGLKNAEFELNPELVKFYESKDSGSGRDKNPAIGAKVTGLAIGETPLEKYNATIKNSYDKYSDAAVIVFSRIGGEGFDLPRLQVTNYGGSPVAGSKDAGQHYLELDKNEEALLKDVIDCGKFKKVVVLINCATSMELGFIEEMEGIDAALWIGSPGGSGANAIGRILNGEVSPSGHLVDTYVRDFTKDPTWQNFGDNLTEGGNGYLAAGSALGSYYVEYEEGIYLGYRYYETRSFQDIYRFGDDNGWYDENVVYPFGYGNGYADFSWQIVDEKSTPNGQTLDKDTNNKIQITVKVKNESTKYSGKDVIQLYYSAPYITNGIEKAHVVLGGIVKTDLLGPGESKEYSVTLDIKDMASYDYTDANGNGFTGYELDQGTYTIYVGKNAHDCWAGTNVISREYFAAMDLICEVDIEDIDHIGSGQKRIIFTQPGLRYSQAKSFVESLTKDALFAELPFEERKRITERILSEIKGRMLEDIVLLETKLANPKKRVFKLQFSNGEFDMVVFDPINGGVEIYEIKYSQESDIHQVRHLIDEEKCAKTQYRFGTITKKAVLYRGANKAVDGIQYQNVEEYLKSL